MNAKLDKKIPTNFTEKIIDFILTLFLSILPILCTHPIINLTYVQGVLLLLPVLLIISVLKYIYLTKAYKTFLSTNNREKAFRNRIIIESVIIFCLAIILLVAMYYFKI